jgi:hypothetical protein
VRSQSSDAPQSDDQSADDPGDRAIVRSSSPANRSSDLRNISLDPGQSMNNDPESWEERPEEGDGSARYLAERPPHHGD